MASKNGRKKRWWIWLIVAVVVLAGAGVGVRAALKPNNTIDAAKLSTIEKGDIARSVVATGKIQPRTKVEVKSKASGIVKKLLVDYGEFVKTGQILAELDKEELQARVREASAMMLAAQAAEESTKAAHERNKSEAEGPDIPFLKSAMERAKKLHDQGLIARAILEDAEKAYQMGLNRQMTAIRNVAVTRAEMAPCQSAGRADACGARTGGRGSAELHNRQSDGRVWCSRATSKSATP